MKEEIRGMILANKLLITASIIIKHKKKVQMEQLEYGKKFSH